MRRPPADDRSREVRAPDRSRRVPHTWVTLWRLDAPFPKSNRGPGGLTHQTFDKWRWFGTVNGMKNPRPVCPNTACVNHLDPPRGFYRKKGSRPARHNRQPVLRYQCKACERWFSSTQSKAIRQHHRPDLNRRVFELAVSGVSMRRMVQLLQCSKRTVARKIAHLSIEAQRHHSAHMASVQTSYVMADELITFLHARPKRLSVAVDVRVKTGEVLGFAVSRIPANVAGFDKYAWHHDDTPTKIPALLRSLTPVLKPGATFASDAHPSYGKWVKQNLPGVQHRAVKALVSKLAQKQDERDPLFAINLTFAKLRNDLARLGRKTWTTTKSIKGLENHVWLWVAWTNGYRLN